MFGIKWVYHFVYVSFVWNLFFLSLINT